MSESAFQRKLAERRAAAAAEVKPADTSLFDDLIPDVGTTSLTPEQEQLDRAVESIDIVDGYRRWCGKMKPIVRPGQRESVMISCPKPEHPDRKPSAWINLEKQTWFCGGCQEGGDVHDIAAYALGYSVPNYKTDGSFSELRKKMASDFGFTFTMLPGGAVDVVVPQVLEDEPEPPPLPANSPPDAGQVIDLYEAPDEIVEFPRLDWRAIIPPDTFLDTYMQITTKDDVAEEFHFWNALIALGFAAGKDVALSDFKPVYGNLFVCALGHSGSGKSRAYQVLARLLRDALPHDWNDPLSKGVRFIGAPGSAEVLVHNFSKPIADPNNPRIIHYYAPVRGLVDFNELSALLGRANRSGNVLKPTLMSFYDMEHIVSTTSLTTGEKRAEDPFGSAFTSTQPKALRELVGRSDDASGFLNRWVFACGPEKKRFAIGGVRIDIAPAVPPLQEILAWASTFKADEVVEWEVEAAELFTDFFHDRLEPDRRFSDNDLTARMDLLLKKLILLFSVNEMHKVVRKETVERVLSMYDYINKCYAIPAGQLGNTLSNEIADAITAYCIRISGTNPNGVTISQIARALHRRKYPMDLLLKTCDYMVKLGFLELTTYQHSSGKGKTVTRYKHVG